MFLHFWQTRTEVSFPPKTISTKDAEDGVSERSDDGGSPWFDNEGRVGVDERLSGIRWDAEVESEDGTVAERDDKEGR
jgi:hypothetical protein